MQLSPAQKDLAPHNSGSPLRRLLVGALATAVIATLPGAANAGPPDRTPRADVTYELHLSTAEVPCGPVTLTFHDQERYTALTNGTTIITGQLDVLVMSDTTGKSLSYHVSGPGKLNPDGSITGGGPWLLFSSNVLAIATGRIVIPPGADGVNNVQISGRRTDLCPLLFN